MNCRAFLKVCLFIGQMILSHKVVGSNGDSARNIGRPSPDSPSLKYRDLHDQPKPSGGSDVGYVHDSGSGSLGVIPYDSGLMNTISFTTLSRVLNQHKTLQV